MPTLAEIRQFARYHLVRRVHHHPWRDPEMGVVPLGYAPDAFEASVRAFGGRYDVREALRVSYRGVSRPVLEVRSRRFDTAERRLLVLSGVHGNEHAGIVCVPDLLDRFEREAPARVGLCLLTPVNPIGAAELSRFNAEGYDINRDFVRFDTPEARLVRDTIDAVRPDFVVSLHEGPQDASFMFANAHVRADLARRLLGTIERRGTALATHDYFGARLSPPGLAPSTPASRAVVRLWAATLGMRATLAFSELRGIPELVLESGWREPDRAARVRPHVELCLAVAAELGEGA
jgi:hypothetical protein